MSKKILFVNLGVGAIFIVVLLFGLKNFGKAEVTKNYEADNSLIEDEPTEPEVEKIDVIYTGNSMLLDNHLVSKTEDDFALFAIEVPEEDEDEAEDEEADEEAEAQAEADRLAAEEEAAARAEAERAEAARIAAQQEAAKEKGDEITTKITTVTETIEFKTVEVNDPNLPEGEKYKDSDQKPENGKREITYEETYKNGKLVDKKEIDSKVTKKPKNLIVKVGTGTEEEPQVPVDDENQEKIPNEDPPVVEKEKNEG